MPWHYTIDETRRVIEVCPTGELHDEDLIKGTHQVFQDPRLRGDMRALLDYSQVTRVHVSPSTLQSVAAANRMTRGSRVALVAPNLLIYGLARVYGAYLHRKGPVFHVFHSRKAALDWLNAGVPPESVYT
jgi:hypothetical protein